MAEVEDTGGEYTGALVKNEERGMEAIKQLRLVQKEVDLLVTQLDVGVEFVTMQL